MKFAAGSAKSVKTSKAKATAQKIGSVAGGASNTVRNWDQITKGGSFNVFRAAGHFLAGSNGGEIAALGTPFAALAGMGIGGLSNVETDFVFDLEVDFWKSFSRGASSALASKSAGKSFLKGADIKIGPAFTQEWWGEGLVSGAEKGFQTVFNNYDLYGRDGIKKFGAGFYLKSFASGFAGGFAKGAGGNLVGGLQDKLNVRGSKYDLSLISVGLSGITGDITKKIALKSMNEEYKKYLQKNKQDNSLMFFNSAAQMLMYHWGK